MADQIIPAILKPLIGILGEYLANPIKKQLTYLCCYSCNVQGLADEIPELTTKRQSVQQRVKAAKDNLEVILPEVESWLSKADEVQTKSARISDDAAEVQKSCLSKWCPPLHYRLSRDALKTTEASIKLRDTRFERIATPVNPADLEPIPDTSIIGFQSRDSIENKIVDALKDDNVYLIGICGMGGIGKTTMAKKIEKRAREKMENSRSLFEEVAMVVVSQQLDARKVQQQIAEELRLELKQESMTIRAKLLHARIKSTKSVLIILDDVWERMNLEELGIPSRSTHARCKIILTSRDMNALTLTEDAKIFLLEVLTAEESWILFRKNAGNTIDSSDLHQIAKDVVKECNGLPLALETVGSALKAKSKSYWQDSLLGLQKAIPTNIPQVLKGVYRPLLLSYNQLESEECRYLFLLCCLFPEDSVISLEALVRWGHGLGIFTGIENLGQMRNRVKRIVKDLIDCSLLMESNDQDGNSYVKMHDVLRDIGLWIAFEGKHVFMISHKNNEWPEQKEDSYGDYTCISLILFKGNIGVPEHIECSRLDLLRVDFPEASQLLPQNFFSGMTRLKVLEVSRIKSLPSSINLLNNLRTLCLSKCKLEMISTIGKLINLEILSLIDSNFEVLPKEIGGLGKLRKLEIIKCWDLRRIAFGVLSFLVQLEELAIIGSFRNWEADEKDKEMKNASLAELHSLSHLTTLHIEISDPNAIPKKMPLWAQKLTKYSISGAENPPLWQLLESYPIALGYQKAIELKYNDVIPLGDWFYDMIEDAEYLVLEAPICRNVVNRLVRMEYQNLKEFTLYKCSDIQFLIYPFVEGQQNGAFFPILKKLNVEDSCSLQEISNGSPPAGSLGALEEIRLENLSRLVHLWAYPGEKLCLSNVKVIKINRCGSLSYISPLSIVENLSQLERLEVSNCSVVKEIFKKEEGEMEITINKIKFPKLSDLRLEHLPSLCGFCNGIDTIEIPALSNLFIGDLASTIRESDHYVHQQLLFDQQVGGNSLELCTLTPLGNFNFSGLQTLRVKSIHGFKSLFSPSILGGFTNLERLSIEDCSTLEEVIGKEENVEETKTKRILFPHLQTLRLSSLPKILAFCHSMGNLELPALEELHIEDCPMMETFVKEITKCVIQSLFSKEVLCTKLKKLELQKINIAGIFSPSISIDNFCGLEYLEVKSCHKMSNLFSLPIFRGLTNMKKLHLEDSEELQEVIGKEDEEGPINIKETLSPQLKELYLWGLPKMQRFCHMNNDLEFPSLETVWIDDCPMLEIFSLGPLHLPSFKRLYGLLDHDIAAKFFFKKEKSFYETHLEKNYFTLSAEDLDFQGCHLIWFLERDSSDDFVTAVEVECRLQLEIGGKVEIAGKVEMAKLLPGVVYEIIFMIMLEDAYGWEEAVNLELTVPGGITRHRTEILAENPRDEWIEILVGEFKREPHQIEQLEFSLAAHSIPWTSFLFTKGVRIRVKG